MSAIQPGALVDVTIKGVRYTGESERGFAVVADEDGDQFPLPAHAELERVAPAEWPPQPGDLWRDAFRSTWFALHDNYADRIVMIPAKPTNGLTVYEPDKALDKAGPLTLVRREGGDES